jgi:nucleotide-binding universal stress UspA family protein
MRILIAIDGSPQAGTTLRLAAHLLRGYVVDEPPVLLTVIRHEAERPKANSTLVQACQELAVPNVHVKTRVGRPDREILHEAQEEQFDLLIVVDGWHRRLAVSRHQQNMIAARVAEQALCPVLVVRGRVGPIHRILLCDSGAGSPLATSGPYTPLLDRFTASLANLFGGEEEITVLHVMSQISAGPGVRGKQLRADVEELIAEQAPEAELLKQDLQTLSRPGIRPRPKVRHGLVVEEILEEARDGDYDLVVVGAHRDEGWQRILLDDLAHEILLQIDRPILVVR